MATKNYEELHPENFRHQKEIFRANRFPDTCPICHRSGEQIWLESDFFSQIREIKSAMRCPNHKCDSIYLAVYRITSTPNAKNGILRREYYAGTLSHCEPTTQRAYSINPIIATISPSFVEIVNQAKAAEDTGLLQICGPGYRKALEFLIKDYLINFKFSENPSKQKEVRENLLQTCINMLDAGNVKEIATRTAYLGNDETHYEKKWSEMNLKDMKTLLSLTLLHIQSEMETQQYLAAMPITQKAPKKPT